MERDKGYIRGMIRYSKRNKLCERASIEQVLSFTDDKICQQAAYRESWVWVKVQANVQIFHAEWQEALASSTNKACLPTILHGFCTDWQAMFPVWIVLERHGLYDYLSKTQSSSAANELHDSKPCCGTNSCWGTVRKGAYLARLEILVGCIKDPHPPRTEIFQIL